MVNAGPFAEDSSTLYLNSGDWIENLTALEYNKKRWKMYRFEEDFKQKEEDYFEMETKQLIDLKM